MPTIAKQVRKLLHGTPAKPKKPITAGRGPKLNRAYRLPWEDESRFVVLKGGAGSGKSVFCAQKILHRCKWEHFGIGDDGKPDKSKPYMFSHRFLVVRKVGSTRANSVFKLIEGEIKKQGLQSEWKIYYSDLKFLHIPTGAEILTTGIDDPEKIKSIADITGVWVEEATELLAGDFTQLNLRLRGTYPYYKQFLISFNPISKSHWLCKFFDTRGGAYVGPDTHLYQTTFKHNRFIDKEYKKELENLINVDENLARIYLEGEWGIEDPNKLFAKDFKPAKHVSEKAVYDPHLGQVWLAFDFNVVNTCLMFQKSESKITCFKEYRYDAGDLQDLVYEIRSDLRKMKMAALGISAKEYREDYITINADASGGNRSGLVTDRITAHQQLAKFFGDAKGNPLSWDNFNIPQANPGHGASRLVTNMVLKNEPIFWIHPDCKYTIEDLEQVLFLKGSIDKSNEDLTHALDAFRYFVWAELHDRLERYGLNPVLEKLKNFAAVMNDDPENQFNFISLS